MAFGDKLLNEPNQGVGYQTGQPKQTTLAERCLQHEQRIQDLETKLTSINAAYENLCKLLAEQVGLNF